MKTEDCHESWVVINRYDQQSLEIMQGLTKQKDILLCIISDTTTISHLSTKQFLSSVKTKNELTEYLSKELAHYTTKECVIIYGIFY